jgi:multidrug efflux pump subunit AcrA (membrane-fusion protein)
MFLMVKRIVLIMVMSLAVFACNKKQTKMASMKPSRQVVRVTKRALESELGYVGVIKPKIVHTLVSPIAGFIKKREIEWGDKVVPKQRMFVLSAPQIQKNFVDSLLSYLKNKSQLTTSEHEKDASKALWKVGSISKQEYEAKRAQYQNNAIAFYRSLHDLSGLAKLMGYSIESLKKLRLNDLDKVKPLLEKQVAVVIHGKGAGVVYQASLASGKASSNLDPGDKVAQGAALAYIVDPKRITVTVPLSEVDVNRIHAKQRVRLSGDGFPGIVLKGKIVSKHIVAQFGSQSGSATFPITIQVEPLAGKQLDWVHVGMNAKVSIHLVGKPELIVPITAITERHGVTMVTKIDKGGREIEVPVVTGLSSTDEVVITKGLQSGDQVVVHD